MSTDLYCNITRFHWTTQCFLVHYSATLWNHNIPLWCSLWHHSPLLCCSAVLCQYNASFWWHIFAVTSKCYIVTSMPHCHITILLSILPLQCFIVSSWWSSATTMLSYIVTNVTLKFSIMLEQCSILRINCSICLGPTQCSLLCQVLSDAVTTVHSDITMLQFPMAMVCSNHHYKFWHYGYTLTLVPSCSKIDHWKNLWSRLSQKS